MAVLQLAREAMRTRFEIVLVGDNTANLRAAGEEALDEIARAETLLSAYRSDSALFALNARAGQSASPVDARLFSFLQKAQELREATEGAFDLTVGPLRDLWEVIGVEGRAPTQDEVEDALALVGTQHHVFLDTEAQTACLSHEKVRLDPGALGKGWAIDQAGESLRENGVTCALLHGGTSSVLAIGAGPDGTGWRVALQHPRDADAHLAVVTLKDISLSVSAAHGKTFWAERGRRFGHVLDPRTGWPVEKNLLAAVIIPSATEGDALSTALLVMGELGLPVLVERFPQASLLLTCEETGSENQIQVAKFGTVWQEAA